MGDITNFKTFSLRHLVKDTQEQTNRTSRTVQDLSSNVAELTNSVKDLKSEISDLKDGLKAEIKLRQDMPGDLETQIELVTKRVDRKLIFLKGALWTLTALVGVLGTLLICWANDGWLLKFGGYRLAVTFAAAKSPSNTTILPPQYFITAYNLLY